MKIRVAFHARQSVPRQYGLRQLNSLILSLTLMISFVVMAPSATHGQVVATLANVFLTAGYDNDDVRYPPFLLPDDIEIIYYGCGLSTSDFSAAQSFPVGGSLNWGVPKSITHSIGTNPNNPGYGLDCVTVTYSGPANPNAHGQLVHVGPWVKYGVNIAHKEIWWTLNGVPIIQVCNPLITWQWCHGEWIACLANPCPKNIYVYGPRFFGVPPLATTGIHLPTLNQLLLEINPAEFGATEWRPLALPVAAGLPPTRLFCIPPWCRIYFKCPPFAPYRPVVLQFATRNVDETVFPLPQTFDGPVPTDYLPTDADPIGQGTTDILTSRPFEQFPADLTMDGVVGIPDFNMFRGAYGQVSEDALTPAQ
jgi:hypothetical protein